MTRREPDEFEDDHEFEDLDDDDDSDETIPCPSCGRDVYEDAERCPRCGRDLSRADRAPGSKPWWFVLGVVACLYVVYRWVTFR